MRVATLAVEHYNEVLEQTLLPLDRKEADSLHSFFGSFVGKQAITALKKVIVDVSVLRKKYHPDNSEEFSSSEIRLSKKLREYHY